MSLQDISQLSFFAHSTKAGEDFYVHVHVCNFNFLTNMHFYVAVACGLGSGMLMSVSAIMH